MPGVHHQHSEVVLWKLLSIQLIFDEFVGEKVVSPPIPPPSSMYSGREFEQALGVFDG